MKTRKLAPWVDWLDPAEAVARRARQVLSELPRSVTINAVAQSQAQHDIAIMTSGCPPAAIVRLLSSFGLQYHTQNFPSLRA